MSSLVNVFVLPFPLSLPQTSQIEDMSELIKPISSLTANDNKNIKIFEQLQYATNSPLLFNLYFQLNNNFSISVEEPLTIPLIGAYQIPETP